MATKIVKEVYTDIGGNMTVEYSDDTTNKFNVADTVTASTNPVTGGIELSAGGVAVSVGGRSPATTFKAVGTHVRLPESLGGNAWRAIAHRTFYYFAKPIKRFRVVLPTFATLGAPAKDTAITEKFDFQVAVDEAATQSMTLPAGRPLVTWAGSPKSSYDPATNAWVNVSDIFTLTESRSVISLLNVMEYPASVTTIPTSQFPRNTLSTTSAGRFEKQQLSATSLIDSGWATNTTALGPETVGGSAMFAPYLVGEMASGEIVVAILGSSTGYGSVSHLGGTGAYADNYGDAVGNKGWCEQWIGKLGHHAANISKPSDTLLELSDPLNTPGRIALLKVMQPTHILVQVGVTDPAASTAVQMAGYMDTVIKRIRGVVPNVMFVPATIHPKTTGAWTLADGSDQIAISQYGVGGNAANWNNQFVRNTAGPFAENPGVFVEAYKAIALNPEIDDFKWYANGVTAKLTTNDGTHPSGDGVQRIVDNLPTVSPFI